MSWFVLALGAGVASAVNVAASKYLLRANSRPILVGGVVHLLGGLITCLLLPFIPLVWALDGFVMLGVLVMGGIYTLGNALYFSALQHAQLSEIDLLLRTSSLWTFVGGLILLREPLSVNGTAGAGLIGVSVLMLSKKPHRLQFTTPQLLALGAAVTFGAGNVMDKALSVYFDPVSYTVVNLLLTGIGMLLIVRVTVSELRNPTLWQASAWLVGLTFALTQALIILAFQAGGTAGGVILVAQVRLLLLMALGFGWLKEYDGVRSKLMAAGFMVAGVYFFSRAL
jgi:drug/metabolite transporter (DMT)-like permease